MVLFVLCFGAEFWCCLNLMYVFIDLVKSSRLLENSCSLGLRCVFKVFVPICQFSFSHLGIWSMNFFLIARFPDHCLLVPFCSTYQSNHYGNLPMQYTEIF